MHVLLKTVLTLCASLLLFAEAYSQKDGETELVSVRAFAGGPHVLKRLPERITHTAFAIVKNTQDTAITFWILDTSWDYDNWTTDNEDSIHIVPWGNDIQGTTKITLQPGQEIEFAFELILPRNGAKNKDVRLGLMFSEEFDWGWFFDPKKKDKDRKIFWSNKITLKDFYREYNLVPESCSAPMVP